MDINEFNKLQVGNKVKYSHGGIGTREIIQIETWGDRTTAITVEGGNRMKEGDFRDLPRLTKVS